MVTLVALAGRGFPTESTALLVAPWVGSGRLSSWSSDDVRKCDYSYCCLLYISLSSHDHDLAHITLIMLPTTIISPFAFDIFFFLDDLASLHFEAWCHTACHVFPADSPINLPL